MATWPRGWGLKGAGSSPKERDSRGQLGVRSSELEAGVLSRSKCMLSMSSPRQWVYSSLGGQNSFFFFLMQDAVSDVFYLGN